MHKNHGVINIINKAVNTFCVIFKPEAKVINRKLLITLVFIMHIKGKNHLKSTILFIALKQPEGSFILTHFTIFLKQKPKACFQEN